MDKEATDLLHLALLSLLTGGGAYAGARGIKDLMGDNKPAEPDKNELNITLPSSRLPKTANDETSVGSYFTPALTGVLGLTGGFMGASKLYEHIKKKQLDNQMKQTEQGYLKALQDAHTKVGSVKTPNVDAFLSGLIEKAGEALEKEGFVTPEFLGNEGLGDVAGHQAKNMMNSFFGTEVGKMTGAAMLMSALASGGATYGIAKKLDNDKEKAKEQTTLPTDVKLHIAH
jgi:hypothetical protein